MDARMLNSKATLTTALPRSSMTVKMYTDFAQTMYRATAALKQNTNLRSEFDRVQKENTAVRDENRNLRAKYMAMEKMNAVMRDKLRAANRKLKEAYRDAHTQSLVLKRQKQLIENGQECSTGEILGSMSERAFEKEYRLNNKTIVRLIVNECIKKRPDLRSIVSGLITFLPIERAIKVIETSAHIPCRIRHISRRMVVVEFTGKVTLQITLRNSLLEEHNSQLIESLRYYTMSSFRGDALSRFRSGIKQDWYNKSFVRAVLTVHTLLRDDK